LGETRRSERGHEATFLAPNYIGHYGVIEAALRHQGSLIVADFIVPR
jgi:hypothetical protein